MRRKSGPAVGCGRLSLLMVVLEGVINLLLLLVVVVGGCCASRTDLSFGREMMANNRRQRIFHDDSGAVATFGGDVHGGCLLLGGYVYNLPPRCAMRRRSGENLDDGMVVVSEVRLVVSAARGLCYWRLGNLWRSLLLCGESEKCNFPLSMLEIESGLCRERNIEKCLLAVDLGAGFSL